MIRLRQWVNWINLATPLGLIGAAAGRCTIEAGPHGVLVARGYRWPVPPVKNRAITIGDVVLLGISDAQLANRPRLLDHEARHSEQWARWLGPFGFLPAYFLSCAWSWWFTGDPALRNHFECAAGLIDGGYAS